MAAHRQSSRLQSSTAVAPAPHASVWGFFYTFPYQGHHLKPAELEGSGLEIYTFRWRGVLPRVTEVTRPSVRTTVRCPLPALHHLTDQRPTFPPPGCIVKDTQAVPRRKLRLSPTQRRLAFPSPALLKGLTRETLIPPPGGDCLFIRGTHAWGRGGHY